MTEPQRILLIRLSHLGDVVGTLPVFHALRERWPAARIGWVTQPEFASLLEGLEGLERVLRFGRRDGARAWLRLRGEILSFAPDLVVDAQGNVKSALATLCAGPARRVGSSRRDWREPLGSLVCTERAQPARGLHDQDRLRELIRCIAGDRGAPGEPRLDPGLSPAERERGRALVAERWPAALEPGAAPVLLQVPPPADVRAWPHVAELARELARDGRRVLLLSGAAEAEVGAELAARLAGAPGVAHWIGQRGLRELAAFLTDLAGLGGRYVGSDSGPMHLAAACGLPVLLLAGPQTHERTGPWPLARLAGETHGSEPRSPHIVVRSSRPPACAPCLERSCTHPEGPVCMSGIEPREVLAALVPGSVTAARVANA